MEDSNIIKFEELKDDNSEVSKETKEVSIFLASTMTENDRFLRILEAAGNRLDSTCPDITNFSLNEIILIALNEIAAEMGIPESTLCRRIKDYDAADLEVLADAVDILDKDLGKTFREEVLSKMTTDFIDSTDD